MSEVPESPDGPGVATSSRRMQAAPAPADIQIAALGDSYMWGQGLRRPDRFSLQIARRLRTSLRTTTALVFDKSQSGARIDATRLQRQRFVQTYPHLFKGPQAVRYFLAGDDSRANSLYGEIPSSFPTVQGQLAMLSPEMGASIDIVLLSGGVNDIPVQDAIDPRVASGEFIARFGGDIRRVAYEEVLDLLAGVRRTCPDAVIMYFGFYALLSYASSTQQIRDFLKREFGNDVKWWLNEHVFRKVDINALIAEAIVRALWFNAEWQYWSVKAVDDANHNDSLRGPGIVFVPSGSIGNNALFTSNPRLFTDPYDPTTDFAREMRVNGIPRIGQMVDLQKLLLYLSTANSAQAPATKRLAKELLGAINGPIPLLTALQRYLDSAEVLTIKGLVGEVRSELSRIQRGLIASFGHPNPTGARFYADHAIDRLESLTERTTQASARVTASDELIRREPDSIDGLLRRCELRDDGPLVADLGRIDVDSFRLRVTTSETSDRQFLPDVFLLVEMRGAGGQIEQRSYQVNFRHGIRQLPFGSEVLVVKFYPQFEPGTTHRFTIATQGDVQLEEVLGTSLVVGEDPLAGSNRTGYGTSWSPTRIQLEVNGQEVMDLAIRGDLRLGPRDYLDLRWPEIHPPSPPRFARADLAPVRGLGVAPKKPNVTTSV